MQGRDKVQPRVGINWKPTPTLRIAGGGGLFEGGLSDVFISNNYSNSGVPYSLTMNDNTSASNGRATVFGTVNTTSSLLYVPEFQPDGEHRHLLRQRFGDADRRGSAGDE